MRRVDMWQTACIASRRLSSLIADGINVVVRLRSLSSADQYSAHITGIAECELGNITADQIPPYPEQIEHEFMDEIVRQVRG